MRRADTARRWRNILLSGLLLAAIITGIVLVTGGQGRTQLGPELKTLDVPAAQAGESGPGTAAMPSPAGATTACTNAPGVPVQIHAPGMEADGSAITGHPLGNTEDGRFYADRLFVPTDPQEVSWLNYADIGPGADHGSSVLTSHVNYGGVLGAFADLTAYKPGQHLTLVLADGREIGYHVVTARSMGFDVYTTALAVKKSDLDASPALRDRIFDFYGNWSDGGPPCGRLVLTTCTGQVVNHNYLDNSFVFALPDPAA